MKKPKGYNKLSANMKQVFNLLVDNDLYPTIQNNNSLSFFFRGGNPDTYEKKKGKKKGFAMSLYDRGGFVEISGSPAFMENEKKEGFNARAVCIPKAYRNKASMFFHTAAFIHPDIKVRFDTTEGFFCVSRTIDNALLKLYEEGSSEVKPFDSVILDLIAKSAIIALCLEKMLKDKANPLTAGKKCAVMIEELGRDIGMKLMKVTKDLEGNVLDKEVFKYPKKGKKREKEEEESEEEQEDKPKKKTPKKTQKKKESEEEDESEYFNFSKIADDDDTEDEEEEDEDYSDDWEDDDDYEDDDQDEDLFDDDDQ